MDDGALAMTRHAPPLPGRYDCTRDHLAIARPSVTAHRSRRWSRDRSPLSSGRSQSRKRSWRPGQSRWDREEAVVASCDRGNSGPTAEPAPAVAGGSIPLPGPRRAVPQPVWAHGAAGCSYRVFVDGCGCHWCWGAAWPCRSGDICSPCCLLICECAHSRCGDSHWCSLCDRFARSM